MTLKVNGKADTPGKKMAANGYMIGMDIFIGNGTRGILFGSYARTLVYNKVSVAKK